jgi:hypothetical protein
MVYYRVKKDLDQYPKYVYVGKSTKIKRSGILIGGELYTPAERKKIANSDVHFEKIVLSSCQTYICFGARFDRKGIYAEGLYI